MRWLTSPRRLAATPGVPLELAYAIGRIGKATRPSFLNLVSRSAPIDVTKLVQGDGIRMIRAAGPGYVGPAPLWTKLDLLNDPRSSSAVGRELGVPGKRIRRWRKADVFCPLTFVRLIPPRGGWRGTRRGPRKIV